MKRDLALIREILIYVESHNAPPSGSYLVPNHFETGTTVLDLALHVAIMIDGGYLLGEWHGMDLQFEEGRGPNPVNRVREKPLIYGLTWKGYELLDSIRDKTVFEKISHVASKVGNTSLSFINQLALSVGVEAAGPTVVDLQKSLFG